MGQMDNLLRVARAEIGTRESPAGSNRVKYTNWYGMVGPWCAMFVSWCANKAGIPTSVIPKHAYTPSGKNWFRSRGRWGTKPRKGAIAYYNLSGLGRISHVGIVERVYSDGSFDAIEGNTDRRGGRTGGQVMRKRRKNLGPGGGFGYPAYDTKGTSKPTTGSSGGGSSTKWRTVKYGDLLRKGVKGDPVRDVQKAVGVKVDGFYGADTEKAVRAFQKKHGLAVDGIVGPKTWAKIKPAKAKPKPKAKVQSPPKFPLKSGHWFGQLSRNPKNHSRGSGVRTLQQRLKDRGWKISVDGIYGPATERVVRQFQKEKRLRVDGDVGSQTWNALWAAPIT